MAALAAKRKTDKRSSGITLTRQIAWAAATDAGNRSMRKAGRTSWTEEDFNTAAKEFDRLWPQEKENPSRHSGWFDRCVSGVAKSGSAADPEAVCGTVLKRKLASNPHLSQIAHLNNRGEYVREGPIFNTKEEAFTEAKSMQAAGENVQVVWKDSRTGVYHDKKFMAKKRNPGSFYQRTHHSNDRHEVGEIIKSPVYGPSQITAVHETGDPEKYKYEYEITPVTKRDRTRRSTRPYGPGPGKRYRNNPESGSESMYSSFHGVPSTETLEYEQDLHYHGNLAALGELLGLKVRTISGYDATLCFEQRQANPKRKRKHGPFHESGKLLSKVTGAASGPVDQFTKTAGKVGGYLDDQLGRVLNPFWPFNSFTKSTIYHVGTKRKFGSVGAHKGYSIYKGEDGEFVVPRLERESKFDSPKEAKQFIDVWTKKNPNGKKKNSKFAGPTMLCSSENGKQLHVIGGSQALDLKSLHIDGQEREKELLVVGECWGLCYRTAKDFDDLKTTEYVHILGPKETNPPRGGDLWEDAVPPPNKYFGTGEIPSLVYDSVNELVKFAGGIYKIDKPLFETSPGIEH